MHTQVIQTEDGQFRWIDMVKPQEAELQEAAQAYHFHPLSVEDCLDPKHLPKYEHIQDVVFVILRAYDETAGKNATNIHQLTHKIALFIGQGFLFTIHRVELPFFTRFMARIQRTPLPPSSEILPYLLSELLLEVIASYEAPVEACLQQLDVLESHLFYARSAQTMLQQAYLIKRKATFFKRMLKLTLDLIPHLKNSFLQQQHIFQNIQERGTNLYYYADDILENANNLIGLHLSVASHRTNEVVRVLTLFSGFFMPVMFVSGLYGMNFDNMPELDTKYGYFAVLGLMIIIEIGIYTWFRKKRWIR